MANEERLTSKGQMNLLALRAKQYTAGHLAAVVDAMNGALSEKAEPGLRLAVTVPVSAWQAAEGDALGAGYRAEVAVDGLTADWRADLVLLPAVQAAARGAGMLALTETAENTLVLRAKAVPQQAIDGVLYLAQTVEL